MPLLSLTITTSIMSGAANSGASLSSRHNGEAPPSAIPGEEDPYFQEEDTGLDFGHSDRETIVTQDIPVRVLAPQMVDGLHEPRCKEPDAYIYLPNLLQLKSISDRFTKLALVNSKSAAQISSGFRGSATNAPKLELAANMHGCLRLSLKTDAMDIASTWTGLINPDLDPGTVDNIADHPSTKMRALGDAEGRSEEGWAVVRVDGKDWGRVLSVGRLGGRAVACKSCNRLTRHILPSH